MTHTVTADDVAAEIRPEQMLTELLALRDPRRWARRGPMTSLVGQGTRRGLHRRLPILTWFPLYKRARLRPDIVAGVVVAALAVPQSLGYASIAGVPVQVGLYAVPIALLVYAALGSSPQLIVGPVSTVSVLSATLVASMHPANVAEAVTYTSAIALAAGAVLVLAGFLRVGWVAEFLSKPIVTGFVFGLTILVIIGELPNLLGIPVTPGDVLHRISGLALNIDQIDLLTAAVGVSALAVLFIGSRLLPRVPWALLVLVLGLAASYWLDLAARGVAVVGPVPKGLPTPTIPVVPLNPAGRRRPRRGRHRGRRSCRRIECRTTHRTPRPRRRPATAAPSPHLDGQDHNTTETAPGSCHLLRGNEADAPTLTKRGMPSL